MKNTLFCFIIFLSTAAFSLTAASTTGLPSPDATLDNILLEVNHSDQENFEQLTQDDLDTVKESDDETLVSLYNNTRFFIVSYWATERPLTDAQKIQLIYFFQGLKGYATPQRTGGRPRLSANITQYFCRYATSTQGDASVYGSYSLNGRWANAAEDFDTAMDAAFTAFSASRIVASAAAYGVMSTAKGVIKGALQETACDFLTEHVPSAVREATGVVCGNLNTEAESATEAVSGTVENIAHSLLFDYLMGAYTTAFRGMSRQIEEGARLNIHNATIALQRCVMAGDGRQGNVRIVDAD